MNRHIPQLSQGAFIGVPPFKGGAFVPGLLNSKFQKPYQNYCDLFGEYILEGTTPETPLGEVSLFSFVLENIHSGLDLLAFLGEDEIPTVSMFEVVSLTDNQPNGQSGALAIESENIFFIVDRFGDLRILSVYWFENIHDWYYEIQSVESVFRPGTVLFAHHDPCRTS